MVEIMTKEVINGIKLKCKNNDNDILEIYRSHNEEEKVFVFRIGDDTVWMNEITLRQLVNEILRNIDKMEA